MPICAFDIWSDGRAAPVTDPAATGPGAYRWIHHDLGDPALPGWCEANLPEPAANSLLQGQTRPRCDASGEGLILNLRGVNLNADASVDQMVSLRIWATPQTVVTVRMHKIFATDAIRADCMAGRAPASVADFLGELVEGLVHRARDVVLDLEEEAETLEEQIEDGVESDPAALQGLRRTVIRLRRYLSPQRDALVRLAGIESPVFGASGNRHQLREAANLAALSNEGLEALAHRLIALQDFADAQTTRQLSRNNYVLSIVAAVFLPLSFVTGLFGVNIAGMPGMTWPGAFALLCGALLAMALTSIAILKWLRLL